MRGSLIYIRTDFAVDNKEDFAIMNSVHIGGDHMNTIVTSKEEILKVSRELIQKQGWSAVSIRSVAAACGVSVGSIYNYFDSKASLVTAAVESVWCEIFHRPEDGSVFQDFTLHSLGFLREEKSDGKRRMEQTLQHILEGLCAVLKRDPRVRADAFTEQFTPEKFADVLFSLMLSALLRQDYDPAAVLEIVRRTLY